MEYRPFGNSGFAVSLMGFGAGHIGSPGMDECTAGLLLNSVLDLGINLIDTARSYGESERRIGRHLSHRRHEYILSTKAGYTFRDKPDWSYDATMGTIDEALQALRTDYIDILHLHSCDKWFLEQGDSIEALEKAKELGKIRFIAYSGENEALRFAIASNRFGSIQCSVNIFDQQGIESHLPEADGRHMGIIAKRPVGNAVWRHQSRPEGHGHAVYWDRMQKMGLNLPASEWKDLALRFTAYTPGVDTLIVGSSHAGHIAENIKIIGKGPLTDDALSMIRSAFDASGNDRDGLI